MAEYESWMQRTVGLPEKDAPRLQGDVPYPEEVADPYPEPVEQSLLHHRPSPAVNLVEGSGGPEEYGTVIGVCRRGDEKADEKGALPSRRPGHRTPGPPPERR